MDGRHDALHHLQPYNLLGDIGALQISCREIGDDCLYDLWGIPSCIFVDKLLELCTAIPSFLLIPQ